MLCVAVDQQLKRHNTRIQLINLDADRLCDIGFTPAQRDRELKMFF